jgi:hypothetical protein
MSSDLDLTVSNGVYSLAAPTDDLLVRLRNRFTTQILSERDVLDNRGSLLVTAIQSGGVKTSSDIVTIFSTAAAQVREEMRSLGYDGYPTNIVLESYEILDAKNINLVVRIESITGSIINNIAVTV